jgi:hypothetical protein
VAKHFLYLTNDKIIALIWKSAAIVEREVFTSLDADTPEFDYWLRRHQRMPAWLITDLIEEDFRIDTLPHVRGSDRDAVIERKLQQLYRASPYRHAIVQGREDEGRRDDRVLFHAVTNAELIHPIVNALSRAEIPLQGISSSAVLSVSLPEAMDFFFPHTLLVTIVPEFGLRQTYFRDKQIKFSRLTPITYDEVQSVGELIAAEASRTWQYLDSLRYFAGSEGSLEVCLMVHAKDRDTVADAMRAYPLFKYRFLDIGDVAAKIKLRPAPMSSHAEEVLVHLFAQRNVENHFAARETMRFAKYRRIQMGMYAATAAILAVGVGVTAFNLSQAAKISSETDRRDLQLRGSQSEYQKIATLIQGQITATASMRDTSLFYRAHANPETANPVPALRELAQAWAEFPKLRLDQLAWMTHQDEKAPLNLEAAAGRPANVKSELKSATPAAVGGAAADADPPLAGRKFEVLAVEGVVTGFRGDYRAANAEVDRLIARIGRIPGWKATPTAMPVDVNQAASIRGKTGESEPLEVRFGLRIVKNREGA